MKGANCAKINQSGDLTAEGADKALFSKCGESRHIDRKVETGYEFLAETGTMDFGWSAECVCVVVADSFLIQSARAMLLRPSRRLA